MKRIMIRSLTSTSSQVPNTTAHQNQVLCLTFFLVKVLTAVSVPKSGTVKWG